MNSNSLAALSSSSAASVSSAASAAQQSSSSADSSSSTTVRVAAVAQPLICSQCGAQKNKLFNCPCKRVHYCDTTCQEKNWSLHKTSCSFFGHATPLQQNAEQITKLLTWGDENYDPILVYLSQTNDTDYKFFWLRQMAEKGHVPLMYALFIELADAIEAQENPPEALFQELIRLFHLILSCTTLDTYCIMEDPSIKDKSLSEMPTEMGNNLRSVLVPFLLKYEKKALYTPDFQDRVLSSWEPQITHPSPRWLASRSIHAHSNRLNARLGHPATPYSAPIFKPDLCLELRLKAKKDILDTMHNAKRE